MKYVKEIQTRSLRVMLREDGILETRHQPDFKGPEFKEHAIENMKAVVQMGEGSLRPILNYLPDYYVKDEAQNYYTNHPPAALASAMVANTFIQRMIGNLLINFKTMKIPTRIFDDEDKAVEWLHQHWDNYKKVVQEKETGNKI